MERPDRATVLRLGLVVAVAANVAVTFATFVLSFAGLHGFGVSRMLVRPDLAWLVPVAVDGLIVVGIVAAVVLRNAAGRSWAWLALVLGVALSSGGNAWRVHGHTGLDGEIGAAALPVLTAVGTELIVVLVRHIWPAQAEPLFAPGPVVPGPLATRPDLPTTGPVRPRPYPPETSPPASASERPAAFRSEPTVFQVRPPLASDTPAPPGGDATSMQRREWAVDAVLSGRVTTTRAAEIVGKDKGTVSRWVNGARAKAARERAEQEHNDREKAPA